MKNKLKNHFLDKNLIVALQGYEVDRSSSVFLSCAKLLKQSE